jgi:RecB family exonuclease
MRAQAAADLEDRRLGAASRWRLQGRAMEAHPLARRPELPLGRGLAAARARHSMTFDAYDGNLATLKTRARRLGRLLRAGHPMSASAVESWATCPFRFFLASVLGVQPTLRPEESATIDPLERGNLIHHVLKRHYDATATAGDPADPEALRAAAEPLFAEAAARGLTGHPLLWENARGEILSDLQTAVVDDAGWREREGLLPRRFEQPFGTGDGGAWPAVELAVGNLQLRFRGYIDRVDFAPDEARAFVFDYKSGAAGGYKKLKDDPVLAGRHVQLAIYTRAVRDSGGAPVPAGGGYWFVTSRGGLELIELETDADGIAARLLEVLEIVAEGMLGGVFPQVPGEPGQHGPANCQYCSFDRVCPSGRETRYDRMQGSEGHQLHLKLGVVE